MKIFNFVFSSGAVLSKEFSNEERVQDVKSDLIAALSNTNKNPSIEIADENSTQLIPIGKIDYIDIREVEENGNC